MSLVGGGSSFNFVCLNWEEKKQERSWEWQWDATLRNDDGGASAGNYLIVADQRAKSLCSNPKMYMTEMVGNLVKLEGLTAQDQVELKSRRGDNIARRTLAEWLQRPPVDGCTEDCNPSGGIADAKRFGTTYG